MVEKVVIDGVELLLSSPDIIPNMQWIGGEIYMSQLLAAWLIVENGKDIPMNPQILGKPGVGKTTLAYSAASQLNVSTYIMQCTVDTRPEDLLISPVIGENNTIRYHASPLVTAMIKGGVCVLDEANRMAEKSWASLAPLLDQRRYIESIIAGLKIPAHPNFRICCTMNDDSSTFEIPEYIHSRLQPQIFIDFPDRDEEIKILEFNLPFARKEIIAYTVNFLQQAHNHNKNYTIRDGINICRYYLKLQKFQEPIYQSKKENKSNPINGKDDKVNELKYPYFNLNLYILAIGHILGSEAQHFLEEFDDSQEIRNMNTKFRDMFDRLNSVFFEEKENDNLTPKDGLDEELDDMDFFDDIDDSDLYYMENQDEESDFPHFPPHSGENDKVLRIIDEGNKDDKNENSDEFNPKEMELTEHDVDPNEVIREFLKRREKSRRRKNFPKNNHNINRDEQENSKKESESDPDTDEDSH